MNMKEKKIHKRRQRQRYWTCERRRFKEEVKDRVKGRNKEIERLRIPKTEKLTKQRGITKAKAKDRENEHEKEEDSQKKSKTEIMDLRKRKIHRRSQRPSEGSKQRNCKTVDTKD